MLEKTFAYHPAEITNLPSPNGPVFTCDDGHAPVEHTSWDCPMCLLQDKIDELESELESQEDFESQADELRDERDCLESKVTELENELAELHRTVQQLRKSAKP